MQQQEALQKKITEIEDQGRLLSNHDPTTADYLVLVARVHCADPPFHFFYSAIFTMFRCRSCTQVARETAIYGILSSIDNGKGGEFKQLINQLHKRLPARSRSEPKVTVETSGHLGNLLKTLASAEIEQLTEKAATGALVVVSKFLAGTVTIVFENDTELQKKMNRAVYGYRATAGFHLFEKGSLLVPVPAGTPSRVVKRPSTPNPAQPPGPNDQRDDQLEREDAPQLAERNDQSDREDQLDPWAC